MITRKDNLKGTISVIKFSLIIMLFMAFTLADQVTCFATTVTLQWGTSSGATGYKVYYQADSTTQPFTGTGATQGAAPIDVYNQTNATISGLDPEHAYYFAVTAYNESGESTYSNIVTVPELIKPTVSITYPASGDSVNGTVSVSVDASDNVGVTKVEFYVNGTLQSTDTSAPYDFSWVTSELTVGSYTLTAKAYDDANNVAQSADVSVSVNDDIEPTVSITTPSNNATISGIISIIADANDNVGVSKVEIYQDNTLLFASNVAPYSLSWNTSAIANGSYTLSAKAYDTAENVAQTAVMVIVSNISVTAPGAPTSVSATGGNAQATISFTPPASDGGSAITGYTVTSSTGGNTATGIASPITVTGLTNGTAYTFTVKAINAAGTGPASDASNSVTPATVPGAPTSVTASGGNAQATVSFTAPASNGGSAITGYTVTSSAGHTAIGTASPITVTGLTNGTAYTFTVKATNANGTSVPSAASNSVTPLAPSYPPLVSIITPLSGATYNASATISFTASASANGASSITKVEFYNGANLLQAVNSSPYTYTWSNVVAGTYTVTAKAYDSTGTSSVSSPVTVIVTSPVRRVTFASVSPSSPKPVGTSVTFNGKATGGSGNYQYQFMVKDPVTGWATVQAYSSNSSFVWNTAGLAKGTYYIQVLARNAGATVNYEASKSVKYVLR